MFNRVYLVAKFGALEADKVWRFPHVPGRIRYLGSAGVFYIFRASFERREQARDLSFFLHTVNGLVSVAIFDCLALCVLENCRSRHILADMGQIEIALQRCIMLS